MHCNDGLEGRSSPRLLGWDAGMYRWLIVLRIGVWVKFRACTIFLCLAARSASVAAALGMALSELTTNAANGSCACPTSTFFHRQWPNALLAHWLPNNALCSWPFLPHLCNSRGTSKLMIGQLCNGTGDIVCADRRRSWPVDSGGVGDASC